MFGYIFSDGNIHGRRIFIFILIPGFQQSKWFSINQVKVLSKRVPNGIVVRISRTLAGSRASFVGWTEEKDRDTRFVVSIDAILKYKSTDFHANKNVLSTEYLHDTFIATRVNSTPLPLIYFECFHTKRWCRFIQWQYQYSLYFFDVFRRKRGISSTFYVIES